MQLGTWTIPLLPAVAVGVAVVLAVLVLWGVHCVRAASRTPAERLRYDDHDEPQDRDWTGEAAGGAADPPPAARRLTVADAVAARRADTQPIDAVPAWTATTAPEPLPAAEPARPGPPPAAGTPAVRPARAGQHRIAEQGPAVPPPDDASTTRWAPRHASAADPSGYADGAVELDDAGDVVPVAGPAVPDGGGSLGADGPAAGPDATAGSDVPAGADPVRGADDRPDPAPTTVDDARGGAPEAVSAAAGEAASERPDAGEAGAPERTAANGPTPAAAAASAPDPGVRNGAPAAPVSPDPAGDGNDSDRDAADAVAAVHADADADAGTDVRAEAADADAVVPDLDEDTAEDSDGPDPVGTGPVPPPWSPARTASAGVPDDGAGSSEPVSFAVRQALAARAVRRAQGRADVPDLAADDVPTPLPDARDRLLSVLLTDPVTALGATTDLEHTRARIDQLGDVLRRRRADLAAAVHRLHASGLTGEQIGQLAGLDRADVREILERSSGDGGR